MAAHAGDLSEMGDSVALDTDGPDIAPDQKEAIRRPMGHVTDTASFHLSREVFINPGTSLFGMTFEAGVDIEFIPRPQAGPCPGPMGSMAVGTFHGPFQNFVPGGKVEFRLHILMAGKA